jgi:hypothetical protein
MLRRVHTVRLTAADDSLLRRGAILLEDALHVASFPEPEGGRVLVIRSLPVGSIHSHQSSASLALTVQQRLWQLSAEAVYAIAPTAPTATAVYFHTDAEPYILLALRLAQGQPASEWFWPLVIPGWTPYLSIEARWRTILRGIRQTRAKQGAVIALVQTLAEQQALTSLLESLTWQDGDALLQDAGWSRPDPAIALLPSSPPPLPISSWSTILRHSLTRWSLTDPRMLWLGAIALVSQTPARILEPQLLKQVISLLQVLCSNPLSPNASTSLAQDVPSEVITHPSSSAPAGDGEESDRLSNSPLDLPFDLTTNHNSPEDIPSSSGHSNPLPTDAIQANFQRTTSYAGLFFLISLLNQLQIASFLTTHPDLIAIDLPRHIVSAIAHRLAIPATDPVQAALSSTDMPSPSPDGPIPAFTVPELWLQRIANPGSWFLHPHAEDPDTTILQDASQRFALAVWQGQPPLSLQTVLKTHSPQIGRPLSIPDGDRWLQHLWITALRRWCRRFVGMGLSDLVCRPGQVVVTRTHVDVFFHHDQTDIRLRRTGLDIDPGWVAWWGQVIAYHYV